MNDNGGINGRPIKYTLYTEQLNPAQEAALARKLIESDKVVGIVGNTSFAECGTNWKYYKSQGLRRDRRRRPGRVLQHAVLRRVEHGPALQRRRRRPGADPRGRQEDRDRLAGHDLGVRRRRRRQARRAEGGVPVKVFPTHLPVTDATSQLLQMYQFAGDGGGIILDFTPDTAPAFMKAAEAQGIVDKVKWGSSTPIANTFMAGQFSPKFDGHLWINQEFSNIDPTVGPDTALMFQILKKYAPKHRAAGVRPDGLHGRQVRDHGPAEHQGPDHREVVQRGGHEASRTSRRTCSASRGTSGTLPYHIPNNTDITVDYKNGKVVVKEKCFDIAPVDTSIAQTRVWEKKFNLNTGK